MSIRNNSFGLFADGSGGSPPSGCDCFTSQMASPTIDNNGNGVVTNIDGWAYQKNGNSVNCWGRFMTDVPIPQDFQSSIEIPFPCNRPDTVTAVGIIKDSAGGAIVAEFPQLIGTKDAMLFYFMQKVAADTECSIHLSYFIN